MPTRAPVVRRGTGTGTGHRSRPDVTKLRDVLQRAMTRGAGVVRSAESLDGARLVIDEVATALGDPGGSVRAGEVANLLQVADALLVAAATRTESRGAHARREYPDTDPQWRLRLAFATTSASTAGAGAGATNERPNDRRGHRRRGLPREVIDAVDRALSEDLGPEGDLTAALVPGPRPAHYALRARAEGVLAGRASADETFRRVGPGLDLEWHADDGDELKPGDTILDVSGPLRPILTAERTALNFLGHLSGVATLTARFVKAAHDANATVASSIRARPSPASASSKRPPSTPAAAPTTVSGSPTPCSSRTTTSPAPPSPTPSPAPATLWPGRMVEIECDTLDQVTEAARAGADAVLLDNMDPATVAEAVAAAHLDAPGPILTEVSGGVTLDTIASYAAAGPDRISVGALTHSAPVLDLGLDLVWTETNEHGRRREEGKGRAVLLVIDVGNTETVIGLYHAPTRTPCRSSKRASASASGPSATRPRRPG